ncbi:hypothetical protein P8452_48994 [Trifolium repens]|nr:hypothetical protein P8452_48994 [Trifolium repens]
MYEQIDTSKVATSKARLRRKIILQHKRRLRKVIARHIGDSNSTVRTTSSLSATNQNKTPLADITNCCLPHHSETQSKHLSHNNCNSSNDQKTKPPTKGRPQFKYDFKVNLANKFSDVTTCSSNLQALNQSNSNPIESCYTTPKLTLNNSTSSNGVKKKPPSKPRPQFKYDFQVNLVNKFQDVGTSSSNLTDVNQSNSIPTESLNRTPKRKPTNAPAPDEVVINTEISDSSEDDPWDDGSDSGIDNDDGPSSVSDTNSPSSQGNQLC